MNEPEQAAAAIIRAANHFDTELALIEAVSIHTRGLRDRDQFVTLIDRLAVALMMLAADKPAALIDQLADAIAQGDTPE
jgi:hypothetical protein